MKNVFMDAQAVKRASNKELAQMLAEVNLWRRGKKPYDEVGAQMPINSKTFGFILDEVGKRLKDKPNNKKIEENYNFD